MVIHNDIEEDTNKPFTRINQLGIPRARREQSPTGPPSSPLPRPVGSGSEE